MVTEMPHETHITRPALGTGDAEVSYRQVGLRIISRDGFYTERAIGLTACFVGEVCCTRLQAKKSRSFDPEQQT